MGTRFTQRIADELQGAGLPFLAFAVVLNLALGQITSALKIPFYMDMVGTVLVAVLCGPWSAMIAGVLSNVLAAFVGNPTMMFFIPVVLAIALFTAFLARRGWFRKISLVVVGGILQGVVAAVLSAPIAAYLFGGVMFSGTDFLVLYFRSVGNSLLESVFFQGLASDPVDKTVTYVIVFLVIRSLPVRLVSRFHGAVNVLPRAPSGPS
jgi:energy-coupling factor transport system substrate-specific component